MAVDPRIPLGVEPMRIDLLGSYLKAEQFQQGRADREADRQERAAMRAERAEDRQMRLGEVANRKRVAQILGAPGDLTEDKVNEVLSIDPETGLRLREHLAKLSTAEKEQAKVLSDQMARSVGAIEALPLEARGSAYEQMRQAMAAAKVDTSAMPPAYSPEWARMTMFNALTVKEQLERLEPKADNNGRETLAEYEAKRRIDASYRAPTSASASEPLEEVDVNGVPILTPRSQAAGKRSYRAPTATSGGDDPTLPQGVKDYLFAMQSKVVTDANNRAIVDPTTGQPVRYRVQDALADLAATLPKLKAAHPSLDPLKAQKAIRDLFGEDLSTATMPDGTPVPTTTMIGTAQSMSKKPDDARAQMATVLAQFKAERDPQKQAQLLQRLRTLRAQVGQ